MKKLLFLLLVSSSMLCAMEQKERTFESFESLPLEIQDLILQHAVTHDYKDYKNCLLVNRDFNNLLTVPAFHTLFYHAFVRQRPEDAKVLLETAIDHNLQALANDLITALPHHALEELLFEKAFVLLRSDGKLNFISDTIWSMNYKRKFVNFVLFHPSVGEHYAQALSEGDKGKTWGGHALERALFKAIKKDALSVVQMLLAIFKKNDLFTSDISSQSDSRTLFSTALSKSIKLGHIAIAQFLIKAGVNVKQITINQNATTPLMEALQLDDTEEKETLVELLVEHGANIDDWQFVYSDKPEIIDRIEKKLINT